LLVAYYSARYAVSRVFMPVSPFLPYISPLMLFLLVCFDTRARRRVQCRLMIVRLRHTPLLLIRQIDADYVSRYVMLPASPPLIDYDFRLILRYAMPRCRCLCALTR